MKTDLIQEPLCRLYSRLGKGRCVLQMSVFFCTILVPVSSEIGIHSFTHLLNKILFCLQKNVIATAKSYPACYC